MGNNMRYTRNPMMRKPNSYDNCTYPQMPNSCDTCASPCPVNNCDNCNSSNTTERYEDCRKTRDELRGMPIAMAYVPWQEFSCTYEPMQALHAGTIFPELDKPFYGRRGMQ